MPAAATDDRSLLARVCCCLGGSAPEVRTTTSSLQLTALDPHEDAALLARGFDADGPGADGGGAGSGHRKSKRRMTQHHDFKGKALTLGDIRQNQQVKHRSGFSDQYLLGDRLARGGFGTTYLAVEKNTDRLVVVKVPDDKSDTDDFHKLKDKSHPHIVRIYECFQDETGCHIVMEYCGGGDLFHAFWTLHQAEGSVSANWCAHVFRDVVDGCMYLHETFKQAHNDIKPENILLDRSPEHGNDAVRAMLGDFGLVCQYEGDLGDKGEGPAAGDPRYAAPELMNAARKCRPNAESDTWSLGITLYEILVGKLPFLGVKNIKGWQGFSEYKGGKHVKKLLKRNDQMFKGKLKELDSEDLDAIPVPTGRELLQLILQVNEKKRATLLTVREHKFMKLADDLEGSLHGRVFLSSDVCRAHAARGMFKLRLALLQIVESKMIGVPEYDEQLWSEADKDHNGVLNLEEFSKLWETVEYPAHEKKPLAQVVFELVDTDDDGAISFDEFMTFQFDPSVLDDETRDECFRSAFTSLAGPTSDAIDKEDLLAVFSADPAAVEDLFEELDADGDGRVTFEEFKKYILHLNDEVNPSSFASEGEEEDEEEGEGSRALEG